MSGNNSLTKRIDEIDITIADIRKLRKGKSDACKLLEQAQEECRRLISDIHQDYSDVEMV